MFFYVDVIVVFFFFDVFLVLEDESWFFGVDVLSLFDVEVFVYMWLLFDEEGVMIGLEGGLREEVKGMRNLVRYRRRLYERCWGKDVL